MTTNLLDASALLSILPGLVPKDSDLKSPQDALAVLLHTTLTVLSFRLISLHDSAPAQEFPENKLPTEWNAHGPSHYSFRYRHEQSSLEFVLKVTRLSDRLLINGIAIGSERTASLDVKTSDYTSESFFPHRLPSNNPIVQGFISSNRVSDFVSSINLKIISALIPGLHKEGYQESREVPNTAASSSAFRQSDPQRTQPRPYHPETPPQGRQPAFPQYPPPENPLSVGRRDLDPIPGNPFAPPSMFPPGRGDGMFVGPDHPIFRDGVRDPSRRGPWGGDGYLPPMGAPPGARFDPIGPGLGFPHGNNRQRQGDPDNDEFMPPGAGDMFM